MFYVALAQVKHYVRQGWSNTNHLNPIRHGGHDGPQNVFEHCAQTLSMRKLKLRDF